MPYTRFTLLATGLVSVMASDLLFAFSRDERLAMILLGLLLSGAMVIALFAAGWRTGVQAIGIVLVSVGLLPFSVPILVENSFRLAVLMYHDELEQALQIVQKSHTHSYFVYGRDVRAGDFPDLSDNDRITLDSLLTEIDAGVSRETNGGVVFNLYKAGRFQGIEYSPDKVPVGEPVHLLWGWYRIGCRDCD